MAVDYNTTLGKNQLQNGEHLVFQVEHHSFHVKTLVKIGVFDLTAAKLVDVVVKLYKNLLIREVQLIEVCVSAWLQLGQ